MAFNPSTKNHKVKLTMPKIMELNLELLAPETNYITINDINKTTFSSTEKTLMVNKTIIPLTFGLSISCIVNIVVSIRKIRMPKKS